MSIYWRVCIAGVATKAYDNLFDALYSLIGCDAENITITKCRPDSQPPWAKFEREVDKRIDETNKIF